MIDFVIKKLMHLLCCIVSVNFVMKKIYAYVVVLVIKLE